MSHTKEELKEIIQEAISNNTKFGNEFVDVADAWSDACQKKLHNLNKKESQDWYKKSTEVKQ